MNCSICQRFSPSCMETDICKECYFAVDDNGIRIKPHFLSKIFIKKKSSGAKKRLSDYQKNKIMEDDRGMIELAKVYDVSTTTIWKIKNSK